MEDTLYAVRQKVYPRAVTGRFATWRWILVWATQLLFYGLCWVPWNGRQALLLDVVERKFYIFGWVFWPQDVFFLAILLIISAYSLFFFTALAGRLSPRIAADAVANARVAALADPEGETLSKTLAAIASTSPPLRQAAE